MRKNKKRSGFTMIEMLISLFIIALLSALIFTNYRQGEKDRALIVQAEDLVVNIREAQNKAIHGVENEGIIPYGYGVYVNSSSVSSYKLFADHNNDQAYQPSEVVETVEFSEGVSIASSNPSPVTLFFEPPFANMYINGSVATVSDSASVTLQNSGGSLQKSVVVNNLGNGVYVE